MVKLTDILKRVLLEMGDTQKVFKFHKGRDTLRDVEDGNYKKGVVNYEFETDNHFKYEINVYYLSDHDEVYDYAEEGDGQMVEVSFYAQGENDDAPALTNNHQELFRVMKTITTCLKDCYADNPYKYILYQPWDAKNNGSDPKGAEQRKKLYDYYIKNEFPNASIVNKAKNIVVTLK